LSLLRRSVCALQRTKSCLTASQDNKDECFSFVEAFCNRTLTAPPRNLYPLGCSWLQVSPDNEASVYAYAFFCAAIQRMNEKSLRWPPARARAKHASAVWVRR
jgi:hypothetical protein